MPEIQSNKMNLRKIPLRLFLTAFLLVSSLAWNQSDGADWTFRVRYTPEVHNEPYTGRVLLFFSKKKQQPRFGPDWFHPELILSKDVKSLRPGEDVVFSSSKPNECFSFPSPINDLDFFGYHVQAVIRFNPYSMKWGTASGNGFSPATQLFNGSPDEPITVNQLARGSRFKENQWSKLFRYRSKLLSDFHGRDIFLQGAVVLPEGYQQKQSQKYPVIYYIPGFGGNHFLGQTHTPPSDQKFKFIRVILDPSCTYGHHVFADSAVNGPYGKALTEEFIPALEKKYRIIPDSRARFLTGHSSGGWSSLWLQVNYPETFGGTWSTAPDPVDFRDFQRINIYDSRNNMFFDTNGQKRPIARQGNKPVIWFQSFSDMENVLGHGGQLVSFEAVFSPRKKDGTPQNLWNRKTGRINPQVAEAWKKYDIQRILSDNPDLLKTKLKGKIHIYMGEEDTFYLEGATRLLKQSLENLKSDAVIKLYPGKNHFSLLDSNLRKEILKEMNQKFNKEYIMQTGHRN